jgi:TonB family protein
MLRVLLASQPVRAGWFASATFSTVTHGAVIAIAVVTTNQTISAVREMRAAQPLERITYITPALLEKARRDAKEAMRLDVMRERAAAETRQIEKAFAAVKALVPPPVEVPDITAVPDLTDVADAWLKQPDGLGATPAMSLGDIVSRRTAMAPPPDGVYSEDMVEQSVRAKPGNPKPRYPGALADMGVEGTFLVRFVVDSLGAVPADKIEFPRSMHRLFMNAVRSALLKSRYSPAMLAGHVVAQQVSQEFRFVIGSRRTQ